MPDDDYAVVELPNGSRGIRCNAFNETCHVGLGPEGEVDGLYVQQLRLPERLSLHKGDFVIWDIGLGGAANPIGVLRATEKIPCAIRIISFDHTLGPLRFALEHADRLEYLRGYEAIAGQLADAGRVEAPSRFRSVVWETQIADFPALLKTAIAPALPKPHAIFYDAYSPGKNPAMWTRTVFTGLFRLLDPERPCALATYSRSTMLRVTLLLAGFFAGAGAGIGEKEETTIAANCLDLIASPLNSAWLKRARNSTSAEPLDGPIYRQAPLSEASWNELRGHPQFQSEDSN